MPNQQGIKLQAKVPGLFITTNTSIMRKYKFIGSDGQPLSAISSTLLVIALFRIFEQNTLYEMDQDKGK
jgi:hypothetical protein